jgi:hypothetical protein
MELLDGPERFTWFIEFPISISKGQYQVVSHWTIYVGLKTALTPTIWSLAQPLRTHDVEIATLQSILERHIA